MLRKALAMFTPGPCCPNEPEARSESEEDPGIPGPLPAEVGISAVHVGLTRKMPVARRPSTPAVAEFYRRSQANSDKGDRHQNLAPMQLIHFRSSEYAFQGGTNQFAINREE